LRLSNDGLCVFADGFCMSAPGTKLTCRDVR
jgi:hypothetical protein